MKVFRAFAILSVALATAFLGCDGTSPSQPAQSSDDMGALIVQPSDQDVYGVEASSQPVPKVASSGTVIDFESLAATGGGFTFVQTHSEDGFTLVNSVNNSSWLIDSE